MPKNKKILPLLTILISTPILVFTLYRTVQGSAEEKIVSCNGLDCSFCSLIETLSLASRWIFSVSSVTAVFFLVVSGLVYLFSLGKSKDLKKAKKIAIYSGWGFVFILTAFLLISTAIWVIGGEKAGSFFSFSCDEKTNITKKDLAGSGNLSPWEGIPKKSNLSDIDTEKLRAMVLDLQKTNAGNLRQDLLTQKLNESLRLISASSDLSTSDIENFIKVDNGYVDGLIGVKKEDYDQYVNSLKDQIQEIATVDKWESDLNIKGSGDFKDVSGTYPVDDQSVTNKISDILTKIKDKKIDNVVVYPNANSSNMLNSCVDSGGSWVEFQNECKALNQGSGTSCSNTYNPTMGCLCSSGSNLINNRCITSSEQKNETSTSEDSDEDGVKNRDDKCPGTPSGETPNKTPGSENYGCSCSQSALYERTCPATRCEGENLVTYPDSGKDTCFSGMVTEHSCKQISSQTNSSCGEISQIIDPISKENEAKKDEDLYNKIKESLDREKANNPPDNWNKGSSGNSGSSSSSSSSSGSGGDRTGSGNTSGDKNQPDNKIPPDKGAGNFNPSASFKEMAECIGFKDGKIPYNGVIVLLLNKEDPTNANHPSRNVSRLFYLTRNGEVVGSNGDKGTEQGGLLAGPWTKGSGGTAWSPGFTFFNAQTVHVNGSPDPCSFKSGAGSSCGPQGEGKLSNGQLGGNKMQGMSGCNMHSGNNRSHSRGCLTMGGKERCGFTNTIKGLATGNQGKIMMATLTAENTDKNITSVKSDYCGKMDPYKAIEKYKSQKDGSFNPFQGY